MGEFQVVAKLNDISEEEWLALRRQGIGASEIAGVLGLTPWATPLSIYFEKVTGETTRQESLAMELGKELENFMERKFRQWMADNEQLEIETFMAPMLIRSTEPGYEFMLATPDGLFNHPEHGLRGVEYKTASEFKREEWKDDDVPDAYYMQCQQCMFVTKLDLWYLAYLIGNRQFNVKVIPRNENVIAAMKERARVFWEEFVQKQIPPAPTGGAIDTEMLKQVYGVPEDKIVDLPEMVGTYDELMSVMGQIKLLENKRELLRQKIMAEMKDAEVAVFGERPDGKMKKATWKMTQDIVVKEHVRRGGRKFDVWPRLKREDY